MVSIVIPAHNEAQVIGRLVGQLLLWPGTDVCDIVVVANGCTDNTAEVVASFGRSVRVVSIPVASKREALAVGNRIAEGFPRLYVDADVELRAEDARTLAEALEQPGVLGASAERTFVMTGRPWFIRWYYSVWELLPEVRRGLFGRGVIGVSATGYTRLAELQPLLADDLVASLIFAPEERLIVRGARVIVHPPMNFRDLMRRRIRVTLGVNEVERKECGLPSTARTRLSDILAIVGRSPLRLPQVVIFLVITLLGRYGAHRLAAQDDQFTWPRDESSRSVQEMENARAREDEPVSSSYG
jgi:glycosyltransferase involved in cell wall biosynthesis